MNGANRRFKGDSGLRPRVSGAGQGRADQLELQSIRIKETNYRFPKAFTNRLRRDMMLAQVIEPKSYRAEGTENAVLSI